AQDAKWQCQDDMVKGFLVCIGGSGERHCNCTIVILLNGGHPVVEFDRIRREIVCDSERQLFISTGNTIAFTGKSVETQTPLFGLECQQVEQVKGALSSSFTSEFTVVGRVKQLTHIRCMAAGDILFYPVVDADMI